MKGLVPFPHVDETREYYRAKIKYQGTMLECNNGQLVKLDDRLFTFKEFMKFARGKKWDDVYPTEVFESVLLPPGKIYYMNSVDRYEMK